MKVPGCAALTLCMVLSSPAVLSGWQDAPQQWSSRAPNKADVTAAPRELNELVDAQFGREFRVDSRFSPPLLTGDLNGDGIEDAVIIAHAKNPMTDQQALNYKVIDPYDEYFGTGDPKITVGFGNDDPNRNEYLLVIHGAGASAWRAPVPKAKFVVINLPFDHLGITRLAFKKKVINVIAAKDATTNSVVFWTGKKYKWQATQTDD